MKKLIIAGALSVSMLGLGGCAALDSTVKTLESDTKGLDRVVTVYSKTGEVLHTYEGIIRTRDSGSSNAVVFEVDGKRISIYNADVVVEER
ncbi:MULTISPECIES: DUF5052 family protein [unclassified Exiguobacterium]|uniref:DUF5052 family protein n=1 Tax=unclassified Exiguobacterium TaxID=2644629 RepID=UPI001BECEB81|nr:MULTISPECIES: DUF5052 family protein [unclassified Exiguobacterium]